MIYDKLANSYLYENCHKSFKTAFDFLKSYDAMDDGVIEIDGKDIYAIITNKFTTAPINSECINFEAHKKYIDIQCVLKGDEYMMVNNVENLELTEPYIDKNDIVFYKGKGNLINLKSSYFAILFPEDAHKGGIAISNVTNEIRITVKIKI